MKCMKYKYIPKLIFLDNAYTSIPRLSLSLLFLIPTLTPQIPTQTPIPVIPILTPKSPITLKEGIPLNLSYTKIIHQ